MKNPSKTFYPTICFFLTITTGLMIYIGMLTDKASQTYRQELKQVIRDIHVAKTLLGEEQKDSYTDLLSLLSHYCSQVKLPSRNCQVQSQKPVDHEEYISRKYVVTLEPILMQKTVSYYQKLESLPDNVRVVKSSLRRIEQKTRRKEKTRPHLQLRLEMNEIKFKQQG
jgi:hypothetical protein